MDVRIGPQKRLSAEELMLLKWRRLLRIPRTASSNQSILKEINPAYPLEELMLKLKLHYFGPTWCEELNNWKRPCCWERLRAEEKVVTEDEMVGRHYWLNGISLGKVSKKVKAREAWRAAVHGVAKRWTQLSNWTELKDASWVKCPLIGFKILKYNQCHQWAKE